ncbi:hypothetical protein [Tissierella praeacuta]|uniref:hypothetical protein n=2 Tax=Tissierella praeacuta TaxID=43131 RepID=UPI0028AA8553|nr:hypothetical protein [Tissierella praeacuta]
MRIDSDWMYTKTSKTYALKASEKVIGYYYSRAKFKCDFNKNVADWDNDGSKAWSIYDDGSWRRVRVTGLYKLNPSTARFSLTGETSDVLLGVYAAMDHVYYFYGNGTWDMSVFE